MKRFVLLLQFLTRIPINLTLDVTREDLNKSVIYFPIVGLVIGTLLSIFYFLFKDVFSSILLATLIVLFEVLITGGLHLDGVSDTFDAIFSNKDKEEILEIMKDPNVGTFGVLSLIFLIIIKLLMIHEIRNDLIYVLLLMPMISRACVVFSAYIAEYARDNGLGNIFIGKTSFKNLIISLLFTSVGFFIYPISYPLFLINLLFTYVIVKKISKIIGGITGDTLGLIIELNEILFLFLIVIKEAMF